MSTSPVIIASCLTSEPLGVLLVALGLRYNMTSKLAIKPEFRDGEPTGAWVLEVAEAPYYRPEHAAYILGFLDAVPGRSGVTVPE